VRKIEQAFTAAVDAIIAARKRGMNDEVLMDGAINIARKMVPIKFDHDIHVWLINAVIINRPESIEQEAEFCE